MTCADSKNSLLPKRILALHQRETDEGCGILERLKGRPSKDEEDAGA